MPAPSQIYTGTFEDCKTFASKFHNTCTTGAAENVAVLAGATVKCSATGPNCVDSGTRASGTEGCEYTRKLCVQCEEINSVTWLRVQGNGLPLNCFYGST